MLEKRALDTLTQAHPAHAVPYPRLARDRRLRAAPVQPERRALRRLRNAELSPRRIAAAGGRSEAQLHAALMKLFAARGRHAVRVGAMSAHQARTLLADQPAAVDAFSRRRYRTTDQQRDYAALVCHLPAPH